MTTPYSGTQIAADGRRYLLNDADAPDVAPVASGKLVTSGALAAGLGTEVDELKAELDLDAIVARDVTDGVAVEDDATFESEAANFSALDDGALLVFADETVFPAGTVIESVTDENTVELSNPAAAAAAGVDFTIRRRLSAVEADQEARIAALE